jgi:AAA15 family ATPase/GTPase
MIKKLEIKNFKSLKHLKLDCKRVNIFIGKPNTGKSNILESVGIFSLPYTSIRDSNMWDLKDLIRFENMTNLFYDQNTGEKIKITIDGIFCEIEFENGTFRGIMVDKTREIFRFSWDYSGKMDALSKPSTHPLLAPPFKFYRFAVKEKFTSYESNFLLPPSGENLLQVLLVNKALRKVTADIFSEYGLSFVLKPREMKLELQKRVEEGVIISYPYSLTSDTLQRVVFYLAAIETNKGSVLIFEEPEAHAFPYYTKFLAERIAFDKVNQYFISTHNPYFLLSVLEKAPKEDVGIFITYFENYETRVKALTDGDMTKVLDLDTSVFFNLDQFLEKE